MQVCPLSAPANNFLWSYPGSNSSRQKLRKRRNSSKMIWSHPNSLLAKTKLLTDGTIALWLAKLKCATWAILSATFGHKRSIWGRCTTLCLFEVRPICPAPRTRWHLTTLRLMPVDSPRSLKSASFIRGSHAYSRSFHCPTDPQLRTIDGQILSENLSRFSQGTQNSMLIYNTWRPYHFRGTMIAVVKFTGQNQCCLIISSSPRVDRSCARTCHWL